MKLVDLEVNDWLTETPLAYLFVINDKKVWLPKSQIEFDETGMTVSMPEHMAVDKELV